MTSEGRGAEGASNSSSFTGTKAGAIVSGDPAAPGFSFAAPRRRSRQPSRERRIHLKMRLAFSPCRRATAATEAPEARASSPIRLRSSRLLVVRRRSPASSFAAIGVHLGSRWTPNPIQMRADRRPSDHAYISTTKIRRSSRSALALGPAMLRRPSSWTIHPLVRSASAATRRPRSHTTNTEARHGPS